jgi:hypothetical protein
MTSRSHIQEVKTAQEQKEEQMKTANTMESKNFQTGKTLGGGAPKIEV